MRKYLNNTSILMALAAAGGYYVGRNYDVKVGLRKVGK